ncbi:Protein TIME FOR COFFEE [Acorus gramineus]|uniref:Protein TIME FOR COFFEE n=1 Tax=Acorus gramineus TaxID=55184 RepID=A0AAV9A5D5_ACOGR|nr:Protein TIME FOR COFFEE [Acorus gramineus]
MDRNREARRLAAASTAMNNGGGSLSRRRQRSSLRDSPEEDGPGEIQETGRLRDRTVKKDRERDRERSSRSKRRRGDRSLNGSGRDEGDETTEESLDDDEEDEDDDAITGSSASAAVGGGGGTSLPPVRPLPPPPQPSANSALPSMSPQNHHHHHHHHRKSFPQAPSQPPPAKPVRAVPWRGADDMIGLSVPRKARSAAPKRSHEWLVSGGGSGSGVAGAGGGGGVAEQIHRQSSTSPARMSGASFSSALPAAPISPTSSNASVRKKKPTGLKPHRPPKVSKTVAAAAPTSEIEIEVAEVLYGLTRQFKQEPNKPNQRDASDGSTGVDPSRSRVSSPISISTVPSSTAPPHHPTIAPKRKRPRQIVNYEEESSASPQLVSSVSSAVKTEAEQMGKREAPSPRDEKNNNVAPAVENGGGSHDLSGPLPVAVEPPPFSSAEAVKSEVAQAMEDVEGKDRAAEDKEEIKTALSMLKEPTVADLDVNVDEASVKKTVSTTEKPREEKFRIDLMAPPPLKPSPEMDGIRDFSTEHKLSLSPADLVRNSSRSVLFFFSVVFSW